jgi:hypothetical protein
VISAMRALFVPRCPGVHLRALSCRGIRDR